jgi:hypothetical protein
MMNLQSYTLIKDISSEILAMLFEGGPGSGNWGHKGRPGKRGGSLPGGGFKAIGGREKAAVKTVLKKKDLVIATKIRGKPEHEVSFDVSKVIKIANDRMSEVKLLTWKNGEALVTGKNEEGKQIIKDLGKKAKKPKPELFKPAGDEVVKEIINSKRITINGSESDKKFIFSTLAKLPESFVRQIDVREITIPNKQEFDRLAYRNLGLRGNKVLGFFGNGRVVLGSRSSAVLIHELAHSIYLRNRMAAQRIYENGGRQGKIHRFAREDADESFACAVEMYLTGKATFKSLPVVKRELDLLFKSEGSKFTFKISR